MFFMAAYGKEIYNNRVHSLTGEELIVSHRRLREWNIKATSEDVNDPYPKGIGAF